MKELMLRLYREDAGQDLTEYALLMKTLGTTISAVFANAASNLSTAS